MSYSGKKWAADTHMLIGTFYLTSLLFVLVVLGAVARYNGFSIIALIRYIKEELLLVLGTSSSEAALPGLMAKMERAGCTRSVVGPARSARSTSGCRAKAADTSISGTSET